MNKEQFIYWLKGFAKAVNEEGPTPKQWETIVSELDKIKDCPDFGSPIGEGGWGVPNTWKDSAPNPSIHPFPKWQEPYTPPFGKVRYGDICSCNPKNGGSGICGCIMGNELVDKPLTGTISTTGIITDGFIQDSSVTRAQPPFTLTTTSTAYGHPSGSTVNYTVKDKE